MVGGEADRLELMLVAMERQREGGGQIGVRIQRLHDGPQGGIAAHEFAGGLSSESQNRMMLGEEACHARLGGKRADVAISVSIFGERKAGRRQTGAAGLRRIDHDQLRIGSERHRVRRRVVGVVVVSRVIASSMRAVWMRVEKAKPSLTGAGAFLMIAADEYPRCGGEQRRRRAEKIGVPRVPAIPPRTAFTARPTSGARFPDSDNRRREARDRA